MVAARLLIVESNPGALIVARNVLAREGHTIVTAGDVMDGLARARQTQPDVVLLDGALAEPEILRELSRMSELPLPLILLVPKGLGPSLLDTLSVEALRPDLVVVEVVEKPFLADRLFRAVEKALQLARLTKVEVGFETISEEETDTLDAELSCEVLHVADVGSVDSGQPATPLAQLRNLLDLGPSKRAKWLAARIMAMLPSGARVEPSAMQRACEEALEEEEIFGRVEDVNGDMVMSGRIGIVAFDQVLQVAEAIPRTVCVRFEQSDKAIEIFLRDHAVFFARQRDMPDIFGLGRFLVDGGFIDGKELTRFMLMHSRGGQLLGEVLVQEGLILRSQLQLALIRQTEALVFEVARWASGRFQIAADPSVPEAADLAGVSLSIPPLLMEALRRLDEWKRVVEEIGAVDAVPTRIGEGNEALMNRLTTTQRFLLDAVDGRRTIQDLVTRTHRPVFDVWEALQDLRASELVTLDFEF